MCHEHEDMHQLYFHIENEIAEWYLNLIDQSFKR